MSRPTVAVIALGGTIAMARTVRGEGATPQLSADDLIATLPGLAGLDVAVEARTFRTLPSAHLTFADLTELGALIDELAGRGVTGVVVTQGTDTLEESAFFLDITVRSAIPVVVTGAMRSATLPGADGPANLLAAIAVAAYPGSAGLGCLVVMADEIHAARHVRKTHTAKAAAFVSPDTGPIGHVVEGRPRILTHPRPRVVIPVAVDAPVPAVPIVTPALGDDLALLRPQRDDLDGLVVAAFGVGNVPVSVVELLTGYATRIPVILASRTGAGAVHRTSYGYAGSDQDMQRRGLINAGFLDPYKARILLSRLIATGATRDEIIRTFDDLTG